MNPLHRIAFLLMAVPLACAADTAYSPPLGGMTVSVAGGTVVAPTTTWFAISLLDQPAASGITTGKISSVGSNSITVANAGWLSGGLVLPGYPYALRIRSGGGEGATLAVTANTTDTLTLSGRDLLQAGVVAGDRYQLIPVDTLNTLFGASTLTGGTNADEADIVTLSSTVQVSYYYNTSLGRWVRTTGPTTDRGTTSIPVDGAIGITRKSSGLSLQILGRVPETKISMTVANSGSTYTHTGYPTAVTLGALALQSRIQGWVSAATADSADMLAVNSGGTWVQYFHNGSYWQRTTGPATNRDGITIPAGAPVQFFKRGVAAGTSLFTRAIPYTL